VVTSTRLTGSRYTRRIASAERRIDSQDDKWTDGKTGSDPSDHRPRITNQHSMRSGIAIRKSEAQWGRVFGGVISISGWEGSVTHEDGDTTQSDRRGAVFQSSNSIPWWPHCPKIFRYFLARSKKREKRPLPSSLLSVRLSAWIHSALIEWIFMKFDWWYLKIGHNCFLEIFFVVPLL